MSRKNVSLGLCISVIGLGLALRLLPRSEVLAADCKTACHEFTMIYSDATNCVEYDPHFAFPNEFAPSPDGGNLVEIPGAWKRRVWPSCTQYCVDPPQKGIGGGSGATPSWIQQTTNYTTCTSGTL